MISNRYISKIAVILISIVLVLCIIAMGYSDKMFWVVNNSGYSMEYQEKLFNTSEILSIDIRMDEESWNEMLDNATREIYYKCDVVIEDQTFYSVGIRPKGNTSLSAIASDPDNNRYSFKLEFDQFVTGQTCYGLDKLVLNNNYADSTNMKEAIIYDMYQYLDADASLYNYAKIFVNGEYWGVYLALEAVEDSFMLRNYGTDRGYLYKPDSMNHNGNNNGNTNENNNAAPGERRFPGDGGNAPGRGMPGGGAPGGGNAPGSGGGANLNYTDDDLDHYSTIWEGQVNDSSDADHKRVVTALKHISEGVEVEKYLDVDSILKYMAVHNFSVNDDSLSGGMAHNYYLYEADGKISIIPWDYNLAFGGMNGGSGTDVINEPIDDSYSASEFFDVILQNEEYKERYHECYSKLMEDYFYGGRFEETYQRIRTQIDELVETDPNAMYTYEEYSAGAEMLYEAVMLRAQSVRGQLAGSIPSTSQGQREDSSTLIDASHIDISVMGQFMGGGGRGPGGRGGYAPGGGRQPAREAFTLADPED